MSLRIEVQDDLAIEIMLPGNKVEFLRVDALARAQRIVSYLMMREYRRVRRERFVPEFQKECRQIMKSMIKEKNRGS